MPFWRALLDLTLITVLFPLLLCLLSSLILIVEIIVLFWLHKPI